MNTSLNKKITEKPSEAYIITLHTTWDLYHGSVTWIVAEKEEINLHKTEIMVCEHSSFFIKNHTFLHLLKNWEISWISEWCPMVRAKILIHMVDHNKANW